MIDRILSPHYSLKQCTETEHEEFQSENRHVTEEQVSKLALVCALLERCRQILGLELDLHSIYRCPKLNAKVGSTERSQHLKCEAADFSPHGPDTEVSVRAAFMRIVHYAVMNREFHFGQLMFESQSDRYKNKKFWLHISLGEPYRELAKCGQIFIMKNGIYKQVAKV